MLRDYESSSEDEDDNDNQSESESSVENQMPRLRFSNPFTEDDQKSTTHILNNGPKRMRTIGHVEGNFATYVLIRVKGSEDLTEARKFCTDILKKPEEDGLQDIHISLCPLLMLRHHFIEAFVQKLTDILKRFEMFDIHFDDCIDIYANDDRTRYFSGVPVSGASTTPLSKLRDIVTSVRQSFPVDRLEDPPDIFRFHMSLGSSLHHQDCDKNHITDKDRRSWPKVASLPKLDLSFTCTNVVIKSGQRDYILHLKNMDR